LLEGLQKDGHTGPQPSWFVKRAYSEYAEADELKPLKCVDGVLNAFHELLGKNGKGYWEMPGPDGIVRRMIGYQIPEPAKPKAAKVVTIDR
jgi:hypothetical protein